MPSPTRPQSHAVPPATASIAKPPGLAMIAPNTALFLDFDGTLADLAPRPELVQVEADLVDILRTLYQALDGALAIISGRPVAELDHFLAPLRLPTAGVHGAEFRNHGESIVQVPAPALGALEPHLEALARHYPGVRLERKSVAIAVHYRDVPQVETLVRDAVAALLRDAEGLEALPGKMVVEIKPAGIDKGGAITSFMRAPPFANRVPLFAGDDQTDEAGFAMVRGMGGIGVLVGERESLASHAVPNPPALRSWLRRSAHALSAPPADGADSPSRQHPGGEPL